MRQTGPSSRLSVTRMMATPASASPAMIARLIGAAPRQRGSKDAWILKTPRRVPFRTARGRISP